MRWVDLNGVWVDVDRIVALHDYDRVTYVQVAGQKRRIEVILPAAEVARRVGSVGNGDTQ